MASRLRFTHLKGLLKKPDLPDGVLSGRAFKAAIDRECSRADRAGHTFSLLLWDFRNKTGAVNPPPSLLRQMVHHVRMSDQLGILGPMNVGIILPETSPAGAHIMAEHLRSHLVSAEIQTTCRVYVYPSLWFESGGLHSCDPGVVGEADQNENQLSHDSALLLDELFPPFGHLFSIRRAFDVVVSAACLILFLPIMLLASILIYVVSPGPILFRQERLGFMGKPFIMLKFRTMHQNCDETIHRKHIAAILASNQPLTKLDSKNDPRLIPLGRILRSCCIDELPQIVNVLRGDMSLVGPRPCLRFEAERLLPWQKGRFHALPGMTGLWQVNGKERVTHLQMFRYDIQYAHAASMLLNLKILFKTIPAVAGCCSRKCLSDVSRGEGKNIYKQPLSDVYRDS